MVKRFPINISNFAQGLPVHVWPGDVLVGYSALPWNERDSRFHKFLKRLSSRMNFCHTDLHLLSCYHLITHAALTNHPFFAVCMVCIDCRSAENVDDAPAEQEWISKIHSHYAAYTGNEFPRVHFADLRSIVDQVRFHVYVHLRGQNDILATWKNKDDDQYSGVRMCD